MYFSCFFNWFYDLRKQSSQIPRYYVKILLNLHLNAIKTPKLSRSNIVMSHYKHLNEKLKKKRIKNIKITLVFYFPRKSKYNCRDTDVFCNIVEWLLLLYYPFGYWAGGSGGGGPLGPNRYVFAVFHIC